MNPDLLRQRRNLIAISAVLLLFDFADVKIGKIGILGTDLVVGDVRVLMWSAWLLWAYFLLRYYQYWRAAETAHIRNTFSRKSYENERSFASSLKMGDGVHMPFSRIGFLQYQFSPFTVAKNVAQHADPIPVSAVRVICWKMRAAYYVTLHTPHATDHVLPFALALAAPFVTFAPVLCRLFASWS